MNRDDNKWLSSATLQLLHKLFSAQLSSVLHDVMFVFVIYGMRLLFNHLMYLIPPKKCLYFVTRKLSCSLHFFYVFDILVAGIL